MTTIQIKGALQKASQLLEEGEIASPRLTAEILLCHALNRDRAFLYGHSDDELPVPTWLQFARYVSERLSGKPLQYITHVQEFYGRVFRVNPDVLIPRPETEHLVEVALAIEPRPLRAVDIGTGSGAIAVSWKLETGGETFASDISCQALAVARSNAVRLGAEVHFVQGNLTDCFAPHSLDLVLSNPPYIPDGECETLQREVREHEPPVALYGGPTGIEIYEHLIAGAERILRPGGNLVMEIGFRGEQPIRRLLEPRWKNVQTTLDLAGWPRVLRATL